MTPPADRPGRTRPGATRSAEPRRSRPQRGDDLPPDPRSFHVPAPGSVTGAPPAGAAARRSAPRGRAATPEPPPAPPGEVVPPEPLPQPSGRPPRRRRRWKRIVLASVGGLLLLGVLFFAYAWWQFGKIERVDVGDDLSPTGGGGTNYLIVGSDSREGVDPDNPNAGVIFGEGHTGDSAEPQRTDTIVVLRVAGGSAQMMALPRDLYIPIADTGQTQRINTAIQGGPARLIRTVQQSLGIPIHHYVEIDFAGFLGLVDAVGGITIDFPYPAIDYRSGLYVPTAGPVHLDGDQALAYVRSRNYTELIDGQLRTDPTADLGRVQRQQTFMRALMGKLGGSRNPITLMRSLSAVSGNLRLDDRMGFWDAVSFARRLGGLDPETVVLPTQITRTPGGASVLVLTPESDAALALFR